MGSGEYICGCRKVHCEIASTTLEQYHIVSPSPRHAFSSCRSQFRRQKRWWSAYLLFYERKDFSDSPDVQNDSEGCVLCDHVSCHVMSCACHVIYVLTKTPCSPLLCI